MKIISYCYVYLCHGQGGTWHSKCTIPDYFNSPGSENYHLISYFCDLIWSTKSTSHTFFGVPYRSLLAIDQRLYYGHQDTFVGSESITYNYLGHGWLLACEKTNKTYCRGWQGTGDHTVIMAPSLLQETDHRGRQFCTVWIWTNVAHREVTAREGWWKNLTFNSALNAGPHPPGKRGWSRLWQSWVKRTQWMFWFWDIQNRK